MAPIYETDVEKERWTQTEWQNIELWEQVQKRERRKKLIWIGATAVLCVLIAAIPIVKDRLVKWQGLAAMRRLSSEIQKMKMQVALDHSPMVLVLLKESGLRFRIEKVKDCLRSKTETILTEGSLMEMPQAEAFSFIFPESAQSLGVRGLMDRLCYDPLAGFQSSEKNLVGMAVIPVKDLSEKRLDRISTILFEDHSAEISFD